MAAMFKLEKDRNIVVSAGELKETFHVVDIQDNSIISGIVTAGGGGPIFVVTDEMFEKLAVQSELFPWHKQATINLKSKEDMAAAEKLYIQTGAGVISALDSNGQSKQFIQSSFENERKEYIEDLGITIFTTAFLGLAFLMTTGSILYFKQMSEAEEERDLIQF